MGEAEGSTEDDPPVNELHSAHSIQEFRIDFLLEEEFSVDLAFVQAFLVACNSAVSAKRVESVTHSVADKHGEADLVVLITAGQPDGRTTKIALLIEDKINAAFQPGQGLRYQQRGEEGVSLGLWDSFLTVLVAPSAYLLNHNGFKAEVSLEQIMEWVCPDDPGRRGYKVAMIKEAIRKQASTSRIPSFPQDSKRPEFGISQAA